MFHMKQTPPIFLGGVYHFSVMPNRQLECLNFKHSWPERLKVVHAKIIPAGKGFGGDDVGHHFFGEGVHDVAVKAFGNGQDHEVWFMNSDRSSLAWNSFLSIT